MHGRGILRLGHDHTPTFFAQLLSARSRAVFSPQGELKPLKKRATKPEPWIAERTQCISQNAAVWSAICA
jgi:hypothetical protein